MALPTTLKRRLVGELTRTTDKATGTLPQGTQAALFTVAGGRIELVSLVGEVTVIIEALYNPTRLVANPTTGVDTNICGYDDISGDAVASLWGITGLPGDEMVSSGAGATASMQRPVIIAPGTIDLSCIASGTGSVKWTAVWRPLDEGASLVSA